MTGKQLKIAAMITMLIDHFAAVYLSRCLLVEGIFSNGFSQPRSMSILGWFDFSQPGSITALGWFYILCREIGRIAFPIFLFLMVEGITHTRNKWRYLGGIAVFAIISEVPFDLAVCIQKVTFLELGHQNVYFTLLFALLAMIGLKYAEERFAEREERYIAFVGIVAVAGIAAELLRTDYGLVGVVAASVMYLLRADKKKAFVAGVVVLTLLLDFSELAALLGLIFVAKYNGERGERVNKYLFYAFYPAHLLLLSGFCWFEGLM